MKRSALSQTVIYILTSLVALICFLPVLLMLMVSITDENAIESYGYQLIPKKISFSAYQMIFSNGSNVLRAFSLSTFVTIVGTVLAVIITTGCAYTLANKSVKYRNTLALIFFIPMIFHAGMVPWYLVCQQIGLRNNIAALIIPSLLFSSFNLFLVRNFMADIPDALRESATLDGANDITIAFRIYLPLCLPVLATIALFYGLAYWNDWWNAIMLVDDSKMYPLQYFLLEIQSQISMLNEVGSDAGISEIALPTEAVKMATAVVTIGPIVLLYPYLQKYFVSGLTIGSVKG